MGLALPLLLISVPGGAIFGGHPTNEFTAVGMIGRSDGGAFAQSGCGVAISRDWVLSVAHIGGDTFVQDGKSYPIIEKVAADNEVDLALFKLGQPVKYQAEPMFDSHSDGRAVLVGYGNDAKKRTDGLGWQPVGGTSGTLRIAANMIDQRKVARYNVGSPQSPRWRGGEALVYDLDNPKSAKPNTLGGKAIPGEGGIAGRDSGGGWFVITCGRVSKPKLVAISASVATAPDSKMPTAYCYGGLGYGIYIKPYKQWIYSVTKSPKFK